MTKDQANLIKFRDAWSHISSAVETLESVQVGTDKHLYQQVDRIREVLIGEMLMITENLIAPLEERTPPL